MSTFKSIQAEMIESSSSSAECSSGRGGREPPDRYRNVALAGGVGRARKIVRR